MTSPSVDLAEFSRAVAELALGTEALEFHGGICGLLCTYGPGAVDRWLRESRIAARDDVDDRERWLETLHIAEADAWRALNAQSFDFDLMLPVQEAEVHDRVEALGAWCHGFVTGMGLGGLSRSRSARVESSSQIDEILADLTEISRVTLTDEDAGNIERAGFDLAAVVEHVRVCVQLSFELLHVPPDSASEPVESARH